MLALSAEFADQKNTQDMSEGQSQHQIWVWEGRDVAVANSREESVPFVTSQKASLLPIVIACAVLPPDGPSATSQSTRERGGPSFGSGPSACLDSPAGWSASRPGAAAAPRSYSGL